MTETERAEVLVTARLLRAAKRIDWLATPLALIAAASLLFRGGNLAAGCVAIAAGVIAKLYAVRVAFDQHLFDDIAAGKLTPAELDHALSSMRAAAPVERSWSDRCRGARRLVRMLAAATVVEVIAAIAMLF